MRRGRPTAEDWSAASEFLTIPQTLCAALDYDRSLAPAHGHRRIGEREDEMDATQPPYWYDEIRYDVLLHFTEVRDSIAKCAGQAKSAVSAEEFLALCDLAFVPLAGVSLKKIALIVQPIYSKLGIRTGKVRNEIFPSPSGNLLLSVLCSLASHGQTIRKVEQGEDGCLLEAAIPSDIWSFEGDLLITVRRNHPGTFVEGATNIKGQLFDWGKSKRCLNELFGDLGDPLPF